MMALWSLPRLPRLLVALCVLHRLVQADAQQKPLHSSEHRVSPDTPPICLAAPPTLSGSVQSLTCHPHESADTASASALASEPAFQPYQPAEANGIWEVRLAPGKGRGLFAVVDIPRGTRLLDEAPLVVVAPPPLVPGVGFSLAAMRPAVAAAFAALDDEGKQEYLSCHEVRFAGEGEGEDEADAARLVRILRSNAYDTQDGRVALYTKVALINHDCRPNVLNTDDHEPTGRRLIVAARDIAAGEEIVTTYVPLLADTAARRARLAQYGFTCMCAACVSGEHGSRDDRERVHMRQVLEELEQAAAAPSPAQSNTQSRERQRLARLAVELGTYIKDRGFADYTERVSRLEGEFTLKGGERAVER